VRADAAKVYQQRTYERLAREYEQFGRSDNRTDGYTKYTCNAVHAWLGDGAELAYKTLFGFRRRYDTPHGTRNEDYLWKKCDEATQQNIRVLMLCFAAAMVAKGDL
jgi:hypothetical protein